MGSNSVVSDASDASIKGLEEETRMDWEDVGWSCLDAIKLRHVWRMNCVKIKQK